MDRLQAVAHVRQGAGDDDAHGVFQERRLHLLAQIRRAHDGAVAAVGALHDLAMGVRQVVLDERLRAHLVGDHRAGAARGVVVLLGILGIGEGAFQVVLFPAAVRRVEVLLGAVEELVERIVVVCHLDSP